MKHKRPDSKIGSRLRIFGRSRFTTQREFATALKMAQQSLPAYYCGKVRPGPKFQKKLAKMGCDLRWLMFGGSVKSSDYRENRRRTAATREAIAILDRLGHAETKRNIHTLDAIKKAGCEIAQLLPSTPQAVHRTRVRKNNGLLGRLLYRCIQIAGVSQVELGAITTPPMTRQNVNLAIQGRLTVTLPKLFIAFGEVLAQHSKLVKPLGREHATQNKKRSSMKQSESIKTSLSL